MIALSAAATSASRTCLNCGSEFQMIESGRTCLQCRKPSPCEFQPASSCLSPREKQVVDLVRYGKPNKIIAFELKLAIGTIKEYLFKIFRKVNVSNRTELALWAMTQQDAAVGPR